MGNGYAVTAVIGSRSVMEAAQSTFISSTFWTERIGSVAALKTLEIMEHEKTWDIITKTGKEIMEGWKNLATRHNLDISINGLPAICNFSFPGKTLLYTKHFYTRNAKRGLSSNLIFVCTEHCENVISEYFVNLDELFAVIAQCEENDNAVSLLDSEVCHSGFKRLN